MVLGELLHIGMIPEMTLIVLLNFGQKLGADARIETGQDRFPTQNQESGNRQTLHRREKLKVAIAKRQKTNST